MLPFSFFERAQNAYFNSLAMIDADGSVLGDVPQVAHPGRARLPRSITSPGTPASGLADAAFGTLGVGICWDQWFPEAARCMALMGAEVLLYPTAIGSEPHDASIDSRDHWRAACRAMPRPT